MKKKVLLALLFFSALAHSQKDNSLFWEISGNGLSKKSYIYGTMHVNEKVSYHLSDAFFKHLLEADIVANESDPETWGEIVDLMSDSEIESNYKFYTEFYLKPIRKEKVATVFTNENYFSNMLSGIEGEQADFQENTVLDMFIFQTGKKYKKKTLGLESAKEAILSLLTIDADDAKPLEENKSILMKLLKNKNFSEALKQYYREKDIVMLDSIYKLMFSKKAHDLLIVNRNIIMANSFDSIAKTGSLFSAVGAAHLAGKDGVIQLLRRKGYTVNPIIDTFTESGKSKKKTIEEFFPNPGFTTVADSDGMIRMPLNKSRIQTNADTGSPDFTNGGAINIKRLPLNDFMGKDGPFNPKSLDSLLFENIAGDIIEKKYFEGANYKGYDIKNVTKTGNNQRYRFYITPLELIAVTMTGNGQYVRQFEAEVFDNIKIKPYSTVWEKITPKKGGFTVEVPGFNTVYGNSPDKVRNVEIQAYDNTEQGYYFLTERTLNSTAFLEETDYEHKQIHHEFYMQHDIDTLQTAFEKSGFTSESQLGNRKVRLKTVISGGKYYMLGTVNVSQPNSEKFFNSFATLPFNYKSPTKTLIDTIANYKIDIPEKQNQRLFLKIKATNEIDDKNIFEADSRYNTFLSESGKSISMEYIKYHRYDSEVNMDSIRNDFRKNFIKDSDHYDYDDEDEYEDYRNLTSLLNSEFNSKKGLSPSKWSSIMAEKSDVYEMISESTSYDAETKVHTIDALVSLPKATQAIRYKVFFREDSYFVFKTLVTRDDKKEDAFIERTLDSFSFTSKGENSVFDDKMKLFIADANSEKDTIRYSALNSIYNLEVKKKDFGILRDFLKNFKFIDDEIDAAIALLQKIGDLKDDNVVPFLEGYYKRKGTTSALQLSVLRALSQQQSKAGYKKIIELLEYDLPISNNDYDIQGLFYFFEKDLENSKELFPDIFQFYNTAEYKKPIVQFCNSLLDKGLISAKNIGKYKKELITYANTEYKRVASWKEKNSSPSEYDYEDSVSPINYLIDYINLLSYFPNDKNIDQLMSKIKTLDIPELNVELLRLGIVNNSIANTDIKIALNNPQTRFLTLQLLENKNDKSYSNLLTDDEIATAAAINFEGLTEDVKILLLQKKEISHLGKNIMFFFFQITTEDKEAESTTKRIYPVAFVTEKGRINPSAYRVFEGAFEVEDEKLERTYASIINGFINDNHSRASFGKGEENNIFMPDYFMD